MFRFFTDRLGLRPFTAQDASAIMGYLYEPGASCFASMRTPDMAAAIKAAQERAASHDYFAIELTQTGEMIGEVFGHFEAPDTFSIAWQLNPAFSGRGYALEAARATMKHLFEERGIRRIYAYAETDNVASQKLCLKLGMRHEGTFKEFISFEKDSSGQPIYVDTMQYAILKHEWLER